MGLIYSSSDANNVITTLNTNVSIANSIVEQLNAGSQRLVAAIDGHTLSGAAYTAGKGLFSEIIIPAINRVSTAITNVQNDLTKFSAANSYISDEGYLDEDNLRNQLTILQHSKSSLENAAHVIGTLANIPVPAIAELLRDQQRNFLRRAESYQKDITRVKKKIQKLTEFDAKTKGLFQSSLDDFQLAMQAVMVLNETTVNADGSYGLPVGVDRSWFSKIKPNAKEQIGMSSNVFLELYQQVKELMDPLTSGKTDNMKRLDQLLALYPKALVDKLMKNDEFWMLADKLPSKAQIKLINGLAKYESFGQAVAQGKWIPKIDTIGRGYQWFNKMTNPIKTYVSESLKNSQFIQGAKNWGVVKGLGTAAQVATYAQLGVTFVSSGVNEYGKTGSIGKGAIGGAIDTIKSIGPFEGMTIGGAVAGPFGAVVGGAMGLMNKGIQFLWPNKYDDIKNGAYKLYDKTAEAVGDVSKNIGESVEQSVDTVKQVYRGIQQVGKSIGKTLSSVKVQKISFSW